LAHRRLNFHFFCGGVLNESQIQRIKLPADELAEFRFCKRDEAVNLLIPGLAVAGISLSAIEQNRIVYIEDGVEIL